MTVLWEAGEKGVLSRAFDSRWYSWPAGLTNTANAQGLDSYGGAFNYADFVHDTSGTLNLHPDNVYATQPNVRKVVRFIARAVAQVALRPYLATSDTDRTRVRSGPLADILRRPSETDLAFGQMANMVYDRKLWERHASLIIQTGRQSFELVRLPPRWWAFDRDAYDRPMAIVAADPETGEETRIGLERVLWCDDYPSTRSPMEALRNTLTEEYESGEYRKQLWKNGGRFAEWVERPDVAEPWTPAALANFRASLAAYAGASGGGTKAGKTPIMDQGMKLHQLEAMTPMNAQQIEARKLSLEEVASFMGIDPSLVGGSENANYSNVSAYRAILWEDQLGGDFTELEQIFNGRLVPVVEPNPDLYVEFFVKGKTRMTPKEQADMYLKSTGRPWQSTAEIRAAENLPEMPDTSELITPIYTQQPKTDD